MKYIKSLLEAKKVRPIEVVMSVTDIAIDGFLTMCILAIILALISWTFK
jgi:hypothetical protein